MNSNESKQKQIIYNPVNMTKVLGIILKVHLKKSWLKQQKEVRRYIGNSFKQHNKDFNFNISLSKLKVALN